MIWLDHIIFGNGWGLASPYSDDRFFWLVDTYQKDRKAKNGQLYHFCYGFGAQLTSFQWTHPRAGERRRLCGREFTPFHSSRRWFRVEVAWQMVGMPRDLDGAHAAIRALDAQLGRYCP